MRSDKNGTHISFIWNCKNLYQEILSLSSGMPGWTDFRFRIKYTNPLATASVWPSTFTIDLRWIFSIIHNSPTAININFITFSLLFHNAITSNIFPVTGIIDHILFQVITPIATNTHTNSNGTNNVYFRIYFLK